MEASTSKCTKKSTGEAASSVNVGNNRNCVNRTGKISVNMNKSKKLAEKRGSKSNKCMEQNNNATIVASNLRRVINNSKVGNSTR